MGWGFPNHLGQTHTTHQNHLILQLYSSSKSLAIQSTLLSQLNSTF
jgi:hypothetical protein